MKYYAQLKFVQPEEKVRSIRSLRAVLGTTKENLSIVGLRDAKGLVEKHYDRPFVVVLSAEQVVAGLTAIKHIAGPLGQLIPTLDYVQVVPGTVVEAAPQNALDLSC